MNSPIKILLIVVGTICVILGVFGIFLPLLPTTPFLLLAAYCYSRSSERFYHWLITNRWFGEYIRNYREGRGMLLKQKIIALSLLWITISYSALFVVSHGWLQLLLLVIALCVTVHLLRMNTFKPERQNMPLLSDEAPSEVSAVQSADNISNS